MPQVRGFHRKVLSLFFFNLSGYPTVWVVISHWHPQIVLREFKPGPYPKHATHLSLSSPCSLVADVSIWATSPLGVAFRSVFCGFFSFFPLLVMLPFEIPKLPTDLLMIGFPAVWKLLLLHDSLPRTGLCS